MFSEKTYAEIARVTQRALDEMHGRKAIDQITVIFGYVQLSSRNLSGADAKLRAAIEHLLDLATLANLRQLIDALEGLVQAIDQERPA